MLACGHRFLENLFNSIRTRGSKSQDRDAPMFRNLPMKTNQPISPRQFHHMHLAAVVATFFASCLLQQSTANGQVGSSSRVYEEDQGLVIMEAENTPSPLGSWTIDKSMRGYTGRGYLEFQDDPNRSGQASAALRYTFKINRSGPYTLHLHCGGKSTNAGDSTRGVASDCFVRMEGDFDVAGKTNSKGKTRDLLKTMKTDSVLESEDQPSFAWVTGNRLVSKKKKQGASGAKSSQGQGSAAHRFQSGQLYTLVVSGRSPGFKLDRIVLSHQSVHSNNAQNRGANETLNRQSTQQRRFVAISDFDHLESGQVPYYQDKRNRALAIRANNPDYRDRFAKAWRTFDAKPGVYDVTITTLAEEDGESTYRLLINESRVAEFRNKHVGAGSPLDMKPQTHQWPSIAINTGDTIAIESNTATNGEIPEDGGTAWARGRWRAIEFTNSNNVDLVRPPSGRLAIVADGNSPDPDDIGALAVTFGLLDRTGLQDRLVHLSHSCDLKPAARISPADEKRRQRVLTQLSEEGIDRFGPFENLAASFNCRTQQDAAVKDLSDAINDSSLENPLWIIEAGEPDLIGYALQASQPSSRQFVHVVSHHPANDNTGDFFTWQQILEFGVTEHQIGDQNVGLQTGIPQWDWAKHHPDESIQWIWKQMQYAEQDGVVKFQTNKFDCSDAGMIYWWITGANHGGDTQATSEQIKAILHRVED